MRQIPENTRACCCAFGKHNFEILIRNQLTGPISSSRGHGPHRTLALAASEQPLSLQSGQHIPYFLRSGKRQVYVESLDITWRESRHDSPRLRQLAEDQCLVFLRQPLDTKGYGINGLTLRSPVFVYAIGILAAVEFMVAK